MVDEDPRPGRFIVTGSQNILLMKSVSQTLAGRTALLLLHPFSLAELYGLPPWDPRELDRKPTAPSPAAIASLSARPPAAGSPRSRSDMSPPRCPPIMRTTASGCESDPGFTFSTAAWCATCWASRTVPPDAVAGLKWWTAIPSNPNSGGVLVHGGTESFDLSGFRVLPWFLAAGANF